MDILYLLIPLSVVLAFAILGVFAWALKAGQFEDLEGEGARILLTDVDTAKDVSLGLDPSQPVNPAATKQSS
jgi:cbb3-type cytochrome oxidase maturation protein